MTSRNKTVGRIVAKAWSEPEFARRLLADTHAALMELGIAVPVNKLVVAVENDSGLTYIVLPSAALHRDEIRLRRHQGVRRILP